MISAIAKSPLGTDEKVLAYLQKRYPQEVTEDEIASFLFLTPTPTQEQIKQARAIVVSLGAAGRAVVREG